MKRLLQDDSGCRYVLAEHLTEDQARTLVADCEARDHKQTFWCAREHSAWVTAATLSSFSPSTP